MRLLDAVLGVAALAVQTVKQLPGIAMEVGHDKARVGALGAILQARDDAPLRKDTRMLCRSRGFQFDRLRNSAILFDVGTVRAFGFSRLVRRIYGRSGAFHELPEGRIGKADVQGD